MVDYDVVVVGAGVAGTAAALSAAEMSQELGKNLKVAILERAGEDDWGGNSRWTRANLKMMDEDHLYPDFEENMMRDSQGRADRAYVHRLAAEAVDAIRWLRSKGVKIQRKTPAIMAITMVPSGGGLEIITALRNHAEALGVSILLGTTAWKLSLGNGAVDGIFVRSRDGVSRKLSCRAVILAGGGFEGNQEMLTRYIGKDAVCLRPDVPATKMHMGECITMALEIGAKPSGDFGCYHGTVFDTRSHPSTRRPRVHVFPYGIIVNVHGKRFVDEGIGDLGEYFEVAARAIFSQPEHRAFEIIDQKGSALYQSPAYRQNLETDQPAIEANTIEELANKIGVLGSELQKTVDEFNRAVQEGKFDPSEPDGKRTARIQPPKSNWAVRVDEPPFVCYPVESSIQFTWGGVATDSEARVLATNEAPIPNLFAAGEMVGLYYNHYTAATSVMRSLTYGRIAGMNAALTLTEVA